MMILPRDTAPSGDGSDGGGNPSQQPGAGPESLGSETIDALQAAMAAEHAALWAYGLVTAADLAAADTVTSMVASHQNVRDVAANLIVQAGGTPVGPEPAYTIPGPVTDTSSAIALALVIEDDCAQAWHSVIGHTDDSTLRGTALSALTECAMRMVTWKKAAKEKVLTVPFPGEPTAGQ